jgi:alanyl-tRNA synthetase
MQQHTAQHLITALAGRHLDWETRSFHIGPELCDIELAVKPPSRQDLDRLEELVVAEIRRARPVHARRVSRAQYEDLEVRSRLLPTDLEGDIRLVEIEGLDRNTCGGTHVASTAEIEAVKLLHAEPLRGGCRLYWVAGGRVRRRLGDLEARSAELRKVLDCGEAEFAAVCKLRREQLEAAQRQVRGLEERWIALLVQSWLEGGEGLVEGHFDAQDAGFLHRLARAWLEAGGEGIAFLTCANDKGSYFLLAVDSSGNLVLPDLGPRVAELLDGKGGGKGEIYQGRAGSLEKRGEVMDMLKEMALGTT